MSALRLDATAAAWPIFARTAGRVPVYRVARSENRQGGPIIVTANVSQTTAQAGIGDEDRRRGGWMAAAQAGDHASYNRLLRDCVSLIKSAARRQGVPPDSLDDAVQETLMTIHRARHTFDPSRSFDAWLRTIAQRRAIDVLRKQGRSQSREVNAPLAYENHPGDDDTPDQASDRTERSAELAHAVSTLPDRQREAVEHLALREQSLTDAAAATGRRTGALKVNLHRAIKTLRTTLGREQQS